VSVFAAFVMKPGQFCRWATGSGYTAQAALDWRKNDGVIADPGATAALCYIADGVWRAPGYTYAPQFVRSEVTYGSCVR
jgi:hypothetical protein